MLRFIRLKEDHLEKILQWRTHPDITRYMYTDIEYDMGKQKRWFEKTEKSTTDKYWVIYNDDTEIGLISLNGIDYVNKRTAWGYYIGEPQYLMLGGIIPPYVYNYVFRELMFNKITAEIMDGNENIIKIHRIHGYQHAGTLKQHIYKYNMYHDVHVFELLKEDWLKQENKHKNKFASFQ